MEEKNEKLKKRKTIKHGKSNIRMFPYYKMLSWDLLFYYPIIFLYLTQIKGYTASQALLADAVYALSNVFWQIPLSWIVEKIGKKNGLIIGNLLCTLMIFAMIFMGEYYELLIIQFIYALGYSLKGLCETDILYESIPSHSKRGKLFSRIEAKASSNFLYFDAFSSIVAGITYTINGYIPMILCFISCLISTIMSINFKDLYKHERKAKYITPKKYAIQLKDAFEYFKESKRIKCLFIYNAILGGLIFGLINLRSSMMTEMMIPEVFFGIIFAVMQLGAAIASRYQDRIHKKFKNRSLTFLAIPLTLSCIVIGFIGKDSASISSIILIMILYLIQYSIKGPFMGLMSRYLNNFSNKTIRTKIAAFKYMTLNLSTAIITAICALLISFTTTSNAFIIIGCISTIGIVLILDYMRDKVGLKPEKYQEEDIVYSTRKPKIEAKKK